MHIYWDGSLGICCQEAHKLYQGNDYNIATMSIAEWFGSEPVTKFRQQVLGSAPVSACSRCYQEETAGGVSRRIRSNQKSAIFVQAFDDSFEQSPGRQYFEFGAAKSYPVELHIDLGNFCNLACKMCNAQASSRIAAQEVKWGLDSSRAFVGQDWTKDPVVWEKFIAELLTIPRVNNIHFMGGETLLTPRFEELVDRLLAAGRTDVCLSFVTNGTTWREDLMTKLGNFRRVGIEISIEALGQHNAYQRQGTDQAMVIHNISRYQRFANGRNITVTLRPAISLLTIGYYPELIQYAVDNRLLIKSLFVTAPRFLSAEILPTSVKQQYLQKYQVLADQLTGNLQNDYNASDPNQYLSVAAQQVHACVNLLTSPVPDDSQQQLQAMVDHCRRWDQVYQMDARSLYPELAEVWDRYAY